MPLRQNRAAGVPRHSATIAAGKLPRQPLAGARGSETRPPRRRAVEGPCSTCTPCNRSLRSRLGDRGCAIRGMWRRQGVGKVRRGNGLGGEGVKKSWGHACVGSQGIHSLGAARSVPGFFHSPWRARLGNTPGRRRGVEGPCYTCITSNRSLRSRLGDGGFVIRGM